MHGLSDHQATDLLAIERNDGCSIVFDCYFSIGNPSQVCYYRILGGTHDWPSVDLRWWNNPLAWWYFRDGNQDINASEEIWKFFQHYL